MTGTKAIKGQVRTIGQVPENNHLYLCVQDNNRKIMEQRVSTKEEYAKRVKTYGWNDKLNQLKQESTYKTLFHGRVTIVHRTCYDVISENGLFQCELTGNMMYGKPEIELPCTGDWVIFQPSEENRGITVDMFPRERTLYRKKSGTVANRQAIASYVDKAFIVQSLDDNFNVRRIERFMVQILEANISPALVLNKADLGFDKRETDEQIKHIAHHLFDIRLASYRNGRTNQTHCPSNACVFHKYSSTRSNF
jgi:ribosome biogenesis GTPase